MKLKITFKIWILIVSLALALLVISPNFEKGVLIKTVEENSTAYDSGLKTQEIIKAVNGEQVRNIDDYTKIINNIFPSKNETKLIITTKTKEFILFTKDAPNITVANIPSTKIKTGLDLSGGARALVKPEIELTSKELNDLISVTSNRLNVFGISDVTVRPISDLSGNSYMLVEVAGATSGDLRELVSQQGKFEAKIGNETIFIGGKKDITYVARTGQQIGVYSCDQAQQGYYCNFRFDISLSEEAAKRHAEITGKLGLDPENPEYLDKKLELYIDNKFVSDLFISKDLKGKATTQIMIQGSGSGSTEKDAYTNAKSEMNHLQTILITGSLPYKLEIVKLDSISPNLGKEFTKNIILLAIVAFVAVSIVLFIKYRKIKLTLAVILTMFAEAFITLAIAALIRWNLDAPSIAGIIAGMGTGVDDQIVMIDESVSNVHISIKERIKRAFFVIFGAFFITVVAMLPLFWAGAGLLKGFALTTIIGISVGVFITRQAFADIIKNILKE